MILLLAFLLALALPGAAQAGSLDAVRAATLQSAVGRMSIEQSRCPPGSENCGSVNLSVRFEAGPRPRTRSARGVADFPVGVRIRGLGSGTCSAESPSSIITAPDGSMQLLAGAQRVDPASFSTTRLGIGSGRRGARWLWLEPLSPSAACTYFDAPGNLALPQAVAVSSWVSPRLLRRARFGVTIAGSYAWQEPGADGGVVSNRATWSLRLAYATPRARGAPSVLARLHAR